MQNHQFSFFSAQFRVIKNILVDGNDIKFRLFFSSFLVGFPASVSQIFIVARVTTKEIVGKVDLHLPPFVTSRLFLGIIEDGKMKKAG